ncbi:alpha/beta fold hydrolase [Streptomyces sp. NPDC004232]|uniref:thioesterase II family protein n=1 Tax=Streptomyces sp. NPDC004232 TaxID=3154454 RepID=UPI0033B5175C
MRHRLVDSPRTPSSGTSAWFPSLGGSWEGSRADTGGRSPGRRTRSRVRLFCVPHAGASAAAYRPWSRAAPEDVEVHPVELPGRGSRSSEPPHRRLEEVADGLCEALVTLLDTPYCLHGHSMGALIVFETARRLRRRGMRQPERLVVSGMVAPPSWPSHPPLHTLSTSELLDQAGTVLGLPREITEDEDVREMLLPVLRADLELTETYRYQHQDPGPPLGIPLTVLCGMSDPMAPAADMERWARMTSERFSVHHFEGGHHFLHEHPGVLSAVLDGLGSPVPHVSKAGDTRCSTTATDPTAQTPNASRNGSDSRASTG